jgi:hypothetical protein
VLSDPPTQALPETGHPTWQPGIFLGLPRCDLCLDEGETDKRNLFVPADGVVFVCPERITHTRNAHGNRPPDGFCRAVLGCASLRSMPHFQALLKGAGSLVRAVTGEAIAAERTVEPGLGR